MTLEELQRERARLELRMLELDSLIAALQRARAVERQLLEVK